MRRQNQYKILIYILAFCHLLAGCSDDLFTDDTGRGNGKKITLSGEIDQLAVTRVNDNGFADGDVMGVYIVDYNGNTPGTLQPNGNRADNVRHTFDEAAYKWNSAYDIYWKDDHTHVDIYGYYPFGSPESIDAYPFTVERDQSKPSEDGTMGGYEASDFLWGKVADVAPTDKVIRLPMAHRMANARVTLTKGTGFADGEWEQTERVVLATNLIREATINLADGTVKASGGIEQTSTMPARVGDEWRAIVVPQTVPAGTTLFSITIGGIPYKFSKNEAFTYTAGKMSNFTIRVDKKSVSGQYALTLVSESITPWENDLVSHNATAKEYVIINSTPGHLKDAITAANKDYTKLKNLKITGQINGVDFYFMRDEMTSLQALNLKNVKIARTDVKLHYEAGSLYPRTYDEDEIPEGAMAGKNSLNRLVLPDTLKIINSCAFADCKNLSGSLIIPEGVTEVKTGAFGYCAFNGTLSLPSTLKKLGNGFESCWYYGPFDNCKFVCELILPESLEFIGEATFYNCTGFYGNLHLPDKLKKIETRAFQNCKNMTGDIIIPQNITIIPEYCFSGSGFNGNLQLHDGISAIEKFAFENVPLRGDLKLPKELNVINDYSFYGCDFSGVLSLPSSLTYIGEDAFYGNWRLMGTLEIPQDVASIGKEAFANCRSLEGIVFPEGIESVRDGAFKECYGIGSIVCKGEMPAYVEGTAFEGVAKDNFTLEVPESAIAQYQAAPGWCDFKRIAAHHELVCRPSTVCALNNGHTQTLVLDAEGEWEVESKPDWCELSPMSGNGKTEVTISINTLSKGAGNRTGEVVFKLKNEDYTHTCSVSQYDYIYGEDEWLTLQKATRGNTGGINVVIIGDGYNAKDIAEGDCLPALKEAAQYLITIEPYKTYSKYFNIYIGFAMSNESGIGTVNTIRYNRFGTTFTSGVGLRADYDEIFSYALNAPTVNQNNLNQTLIIIVPNTTEYGGICQMWEDGSAIAFCPRSTYGYPLDTRGVIQHEAGGHGFGKLGDEYIYHNAFIDFCNCTCCGHVDAINWAKSLGWYDNLSLTGKMHEVPWSHLISDSRYSDVVDIYEGGFMHSRGVFRSEQNSCMNNDIPYYSTISRESIVRRIKRYAGETFSFEEFVANDKRDAGIVTRGMGVGSVSVGHGQHMPPKIHKGSPFSNMRKARRHR